MPVTHPTWAGINFGFDYTDSDQYRSFVRTEQGSLENRRAKFSFPNVDGAMVQYLGTGPRQIVWYMTTFFKTLAVMNAFEDAIEAMIQDGPYTMVLHERTMQRVELIEFPKVALQGTAGNFSFFKEYVLVFEDLNP